MPHPIQVPSDIVRNWQEMADLLAEIMQVPSALIMKVEAPNIKVLVASACTGNPWEPDEVAPLNGGTYCERVMQTGQLLLVADALQEEEWKSNPDIELGMISYLGLPISWPDGEIFGTICVLDSKRNEYSEVYRQLMRHCRDVAQAHLRTLVTVDTQRERCCQEAQTDLARASRFATVERLTAAIAQGVKQPIAATVRKAQAALCSLDCQPPDLTKVRQVLGSIVEDSNRAAEIIGRMLDLSNRAPVWQDRLDINEAIREVIELTRGEAVKNGVLLRTKLADGLPLIHGNQVELQQVVFHLIVNTIEALSGFGSEAREGLITTGQSEPSGVVIALVAPAHLAGVFHAFDTTKPGGLGIALSICRSIIEVHGGRWSATAGIAQGSTFQFTLPAQPEISNGR